MQQTDRIELMKVAAMLVSACNYSDKTRTGIAELFEHFYDYLQLKQEAANDAN